MWDASWCLFFFSWALLLLWVFTRLLLLFCALRYKYRKSRIFKQIPCHELFADVFSIHSGEPFSLFNIKLSSSILHVQEVQFFFFTGNFKKQTFSEKYCHLAITRNIKCNNLHLTLCLPALYILLGNQKWKGQTLLRRQILIAF